MKFLSPLLAVLLAVSASASSAENLHSSSIYMVDGDTAKVAGRNFRLVGFDTPETWKPKCDYEKALGTNATERARSLIKQAGVVNFVVLPGLDKYGRGLAKIYIQGRDLGDILISEGLAREYTYGRRSSWCG